MSTRTHTSPIAAVYARALLGVAGPERRDAMADALEAFVTGLAQVPEMRVFLETPAVDTATKQRVLESLRGTLDDQLLDFLGVLVGKRRAGELDHIAAAYRDLADRAAGRVQASLRSAVALDEELLQQVRAGLQKRLGRDVVLTTAVDPRLIAGLVVQAEDTVWEASARGWLNRIAKEMVRSSGYED
jgi:F-type H+-transporting ATPase subunit delta